MTSAPHPEPKPGGLVALEISVATVQLSVDDRIDKAGELAEPLCDHWTAVGLGIREALARALTNHEQQYAPWSRGAPSSTGDI